MLQSCLFTVLHVRRNQSSNQNYYLCRFSVCYDVALEEVVNHCVLGGQSCSTPQQHSCAVGGRWFRWTLSKCQKKKQRLLSRIQFPLFSSFAFERPDVLFPQCNILWIILKDFKHNFACMLYFLSDYAGNVERRNRLTGRFSVFRTGTHTIHVELISQGNKSTRRTWVKVNSFLQNTIQLYNGTELNRSVDHRNKA